MNRYETVEVRLEFKPTELLHKVDIEKAIENYDEYSNMRMEDCVGELACEYLQEDVINEDAFVEFPYKSFLRNIKIFPEKAKFDLETANDWREEIKEYESELDYTMPFLVPCEVDLYGFLCDIMGKKTIDEILEEQGRQP